MSWVGLRARTDEGVRPDAHELVHARHAADRHVRTDLDVSPQLHGVGEDRVIADHAVVRHVHVGHQQAVRPDPRDAAVARTPVQGAVLADRRPRPDLEARRLARRTSDPAGPCRARRPWCTTQSSASASVPLDEDVRGDPHPFSDLHARTDDRVRAHRRGLRRSGPPDRRWPMGWMPGAASVAGELTGPPASPSSSLRPRPARPPALTPRMRKTEPRTCTSSTSYSSVSPGRTGRRNRTSSSAMK